MDMYLNSADEQKLRELCEKYPNVIGPISGRAAISVAGEGAAGLSENLSGAGDPNLFYACLRLAEEIVLPDGVALCERAEGISVLGVWW